MFIGVAPYCITSDTVKGETTATYDGQNWEAEMEKKREIMKALSEAT